jgi:hypothetical protein
MSWRRERYWDPDFAASAVVSLFYVFLSLVGLYKQVRQGLSLFFGI